MNLKPMLASDAVLEKIQFPRIVQPKTDGVRGLHIKDYLTGRSLKKFANRYTTEYFSVPWFKGFDGELYCGHKGDADLCRKTTSALTTISGEPVVNWKIFDCIDPVTFEWNYSERLAEAAQRVEWLKLNYGYNRIEVVDWKFCYNLDELLDYETNCLDFGYEGIIIRDPYGKYKSGRSTVKEGGLLRLKRYQDAEAIVTELEEAETNLNEATINELGYTERSSHIANKKGSGLLGSLICKDLKTGDYIKVSAGKLNHDERKYYWNNPSAMCGQVIKYRHFPHGQKDKPRHPTFQSFRMEEDL